MEYQTRHLIAIREMRHEGQHLQAGDRFAASEIDANYYLTSGMAHVPQAAQAVEVTPAAPSVSADEAPQKRRGRPPKAAQAAADEAANGAEEIPAPAAVDGDPFAAAESTDENAA